MVKSIGVSTRTRSTSHQRFSDDPSSIPRDATTIILRYTSHRYASYDSTFFLLPVLRAISRPLNFLSSKILEIPRGFMYLCLVDNAAIKFTRSMAQNSRCTLQKLKSKFLYSQHLSFPDSHENINIEITRIIICSLIIADTVFMADSR